MAASRPASRRPAGRRFGRAAAVAVLAGGGPVMAEPEERAIRVQAAYTADLLGNVSGGLQQDGALLGKLNASVEADGDKLGLPGVTGFLSLQQLHGPRFSEKIVGDAQVASNIEAGASPAVFEAWIQAGLPGEASVKAGLVDLNTEFDVQSVGSLFLSSSHGIGPDFSQSGENGPSIFPTTAGAVVLSKRRGAWTGRLGLFDPAAGVADRPRAVRFRPPGQEGLLSVVEVEHAVSDRTVVKGGAWGYSTRFDAVEPSEGDEEPRRLAKSRGAYGTIEQVLWRRDDDWSADGWVRAGVADARVNLIGSYLGGGVAWGSPDLRWGVAVAHAQLGRPARRAAAATGDGVRPAETAVEFTVRKLVRPGLALQPDVQWIINPSWRPDLDDAFVVGLRTVIEVP